MIVYRGSRGTPTCLDGWAVLAVMPFPPNAKIQSGAGRWSLNMVHQNGNNFPLEIFNLEEAARQEQARVLDNIRDHHRDAGDVWVIDAINPASLKSIQLVQ